MMPTSQVGLFPSPFSFLFFYIFYVPSPFSLPASDSTLDIRAGPPFDWEHSCCYFLSQEEEAKKLVSEAIAAGIFNDLGSGSNVDLCVISKSKLDFLRPYSVPNKKGTR